MSETKKCGCYTKKNLIENTKKSETEKVDRRRFFSQGYGSISSQVNLKNHLMGEILNSIFINDRQKLKPHFKMNKNPKETSIFSTIEVKKFTCHYQLFFT